jgi:tyrosinase
VAVAIDARAAQSVLADAGTKEPSHVYLSIDDIAGDANPGTVYGIYLNLPEDAGPDVAEARHAGNLSFFGIERARNPRGDEQAHGLRVVHDITALTGRLAAEGDWDGRHVTVTFRPFGLVPHDQPERAHALPESMSDSDPPVTVGRVSILYE